MINKIIKFFEKNLPTSVKIGIGIFILVAFYLGFIYDPVSITDSAVMITRLDGRSGGSGVVIRSDEGKSEVITNSHVCEILGNGGVVTTHNGVNAAVAYYKKSEIHDLCLVTVLKNLHAKAKLSDHAPKVLDQATTVGYPNLLPIMVSRGLFSDSMFIQVVTGFRECTDKDMQNPRTATFCIFVGGIPLIKTYSTTVVSTLIMAGSSGSGVFNSKDELSGLVFAGQDGGISFTFAVPFDAVQHFLNEEVYRLLPAKPDYNVNLGDDNKKQHHFIKATEFCQKVENKDDDVCKLLNIKLL